MVLKALIIGVTLGSIPSNRKKYYCEKMKRNRTKEQKLKA